LRKLAHRTVMFAGVGAIGAMSMLFVKPELAEHIKAISPFSTAATVATAATVQQDAAAAPAQDKPVPTLAVKDKEEQKPVAALESSKVAQAVASHAEPADAPETAAQPKKAVADALPRDQAWVTNWLAKRYRVAGDAANMLVATTYNTAREINFDPLLILAVIAIESGFNPFAESPVGAKGLMQVMASVHHDKFRPLGGLKAALNPAANIKVGATILRDYVRETGSLEGGLKRYVGAAAFDNDAGYGWKVLAEYRRLKEVASGKRVPVTGPTLAAKAPVKPAPQPAAEDRPEQQARAGRPGAQNESDADGVMSASL
jgi:soluble lytic murein transglycosylase-like protein